MAGYGQGLDGGRAGGRYGGQSNLGGRGLFNRPANYNTYAGGRSGLGGISAFGQANTGRYGNAMGGNAMGNQLMGASNKMNSQMMSPWQTGMGAMAGRSQEELMPPGRFQQAKLLGAVNQLKQMGNPESKLALNILNSVFSGSDGADDNYGAPANKMRRLNQGIGFVDNRGPGVGTSLMPSPPTRKLPTSDLRSWIDHSGRSISGGYMSNDQKKKANWNRSKDRAGAAGNRQSGSYQNKRSLMDKKALAAVEKENNSEHIDIPVEAIRCHMCDLYTFTSAKAFLRHVHSSNHKAMAQIFHAKGAALLEILRADSKLISQRDINKPWKKTDGRQIGRCHQCQCLIMNKPKNHYTSDEHKRVDNFLRVGCCGRVFFDRVELEEHRLTLAHLKKQYYIRMKKKNVKEPSEAKKDDKDKSEGNEEKDEEEKIEDEKNEAEEEEEETEKEDKTEAQDDKEDKEEEEEKMDVEEGKEAPSSDKNEEEEETKEESEETDKTQTEESKVKKSSEEADEERVINDPLEKLKIAVNQKEDKAPIKYVYYDPGLPIGLNFIGRKTRFQCRLCGQYMLPLIEEAKEHCCKEEHYKLVEANLAKAKEKKEKDSEKAEQDDDVTAEDIDNMETVDEAKFEGDSDADEDEDYHENVHEGKDDAAHEDDGEEELGEGEEEEEEKEQGHEDEADEGVETVEGQAPDNEEEEEAEGEEEEEEEMGDEEEVGEEEEEAEYEEDDN